MGSRNVDQIPPEWLAEIQHDVAEVLNLIEVHSEFRPDARLRDGIMAGRLQHAKNHLRFEEKAEQRIEFGLLCARGCDRSEIVRHLYRLTGAGPKVVPDFEAAVNLDRNELKDFYGRVGAFLWELEHLLLPSGRVLIPEEVRSQLDEIPRLLQLLVATIDTLAEALDGRKHKGSAGSDKHAVLEFLKYVRDRVGDYQLNEVAGLLTEALGETVTAGALGKLVERNLP